MTAEELMIGDWVQIVPDAPVMPNEYHRIDWIRTGETGLDNRKIVTYPYLQPIPLTPEILEKNGFVKSERFEVWKIINDEYELRITPWRFSVIFLDEDGSDKEEFSAPRPKYVHELQHALRLCRIDKDIEL